jgi:trimethylamine--corrinoid protein Co-methyltransferase
MAQRANVLWKKQLAEYVAPPLDPGVDEALQDYMNRRKSSFADSAY